MQITSPSWAGCLVLAPLHAGGWAASDRRLKTDVKKIGETPIKGVNAYSFRYKGSPIQHLGAMAQKSRRFGAVGKMANGQRLFITDGLQKRWGPDQWICSLSFCLPTARQRQSIERRRKMADAMMQAGMETTPIASPWQGAARMAQALQVA